MGKVSELFLKKYGNNANEKKNIGIALRLTAVAIGMLILLGVITISLSAVNMQKSMKDKEKESLRNTAYTLKNAYYVLYRGDFEKLKNDTEFSKGEMENAVNAVSSATQEADAVSSATMEQINAMTIMDTLHDETGVDISIFWGGVRIATSFRDASGARLVGTEIDPEVKRKVVDLSEEFFSENIIVEDHSHYAYYIPISNGSEVLGVLGVAQDSRAIEREIKKNIIELLFFQLLIMVLASIGLFLVLRRISNCIKMASEVLCVVADGDLTIEVNQKLINRRDEIGQLGVSAVRLRDKIREMMGNINHSIEILSNSADELDLSTKKARLTVDDVAKAMEDISRGASSQAEDTQFANGSVIEVGNEINNIAEAMNALKSQSEVISQASQQADVIADKLEGSANNTMRAVDKIAIQTEATNLAAEDIQKALGVITDIAKKTNLLSLNASIEAARAGEHGKGFGVVADEIKSLANQSGKSAQEITGILDKLLEESRKSLEVVGSVKNIIQDQKSRLDDTRQQFIVVREGVEESENRIEGIYERITNLNIQRDALVDAIESLSAISEENAASTEETTASMTEINETIGSITEKAAELRNMSNLLKQSLKIFKLSE